WPSLALGLGIVAQALLGGITVLTGLNPWVVGAHFVVSGILIAIAAMLVWRVYKPSESSKSNRTGLSWLVLVVGWISVLVGIVVTGAGPHAGDAKTPRNGLDLEIWQHLHSYPGYLMLALIVLQLWLSRKELAKLSSKITAGLFVAGVIQAIIGVAQARLGVPPFLVAAHMLGASVIIALLTFNLVANKSSK
ncbi:MAG: hypothetical protein RI933_52, partial [Actinomycetota bacterium]